MSFFATVDLIPQLVSYPGARLQPPIGRPPDGVDIGTVKPETGLFPKHGAAEGEPLSLPCLTP
jgi:hypothetical protein